MPNPLITNVNVSTGEVEVREMTDAEVAQREKDYEASLASVAPEVEA